MSDEQLIKLTIYYGGAMTKEDEDYNYREKLGFKTLFWKLSEIKWLKFEEFIRSECMRMPIKLIWFKKASEDMKMMKYVFDTLNSDMKHLSSAAKSAGEVDVFLEHSCGGDEIDGGYEPDQDEGMVEEGDESGDDNSDEDNRPPKEDDDREESEDEAPVKEKEKDGNCLNEMKNQEDENQNVEEGLMENQNANVRLPEIDEGDDVIINVGNGGDDDRFKLVFEEGEARNTELDETTRKLAEEQAAEEKEEETDPEFGLEDLKYPNTPLDTDEEWEQWKNPKREKGKDKFHGDFDKEPYIWLFQTFNSGLEFKDQLLRYSLNTQFDVKMAKSEANRIAAVCCKEKCPWKFFCSVEKPLIKWMVKVCHYNHNHGKSSRVSMLKQGVIGGLFREEIRRNINLQANEIKNIIKERYNIVVNISKCYKGRRIALDSVLQAQTIQFGKLWDYEAELIRSNKCITTEILTVDTNGIQQFQCFYICFEVFRKTWNKCCRPVIGLDGCFLKWDLEGDLLAAVGRDADNKMYPIAWAVVTGENKDTWGWFIQKLKTDLNLGICDKLTIISDKQKGLVHAIANELPRAEHRMCAGHIYANWKKSFSMSEYKNLFWGVAYSYHKGEFDERMKSVYSYDPFAYEFGTSKVTPSDEMFEGSSRKSYRAEDANEVYSVASVKSKNRVVNDATVKTLSDQLNEVLGDSDDLVSCKRRNARKRRRFRGTRRAARKVNVRDSAGNHKREVSRGEEEDEEEEEDREQNMNRAAPRNGCGIPFNWSRIHHRGRTFLDIAGRSLSCGISDPKGRKSETDMRMLSDSSSSFTKSDREAVPLLVDSAGNEEGWEHDYSGELGLFADDLLKNGKDSDFGNRRNARRHQSFTQKYSPRTFRDLVGQSLTVQALSNAVAKQRVGLLYVFHGPNGTGKTSCARTFARALNCHSTELSRPCGRCSSCVSYDNGKNRNIREMGPVKNFDFERLSDDMMMISQQKRQHLVFIFDDCDSMSTHCWNSLSKIVDGAPRRVAFVLVCSSLDALPHIVVSRCQRFFFTKLKDADIVDSLQRIASKEEIDIDEDALKLVASKSDGSLRDAEMTLEQLSLLGTRISVPLVQEMVGLISDEKLVDLLDLALSADTVNTVKNLRILMETGVEPLAIMSQLATVITDILAGSYDLGKEQHRRKFFRRQPLTKKDMEKLRQALKTLSESEKQLRVSNDKLTWLTAALLQLAPDQRCSSSADASFNRSPLMQDLNPSNKAAAEGFRDCNGQGLSSKKRPSVEDIWLAVLDKVRVSGLREFLYREAKIFSISIGSAPTVQLMFDSLLGKSTAESFEDHILRAFEAVLGSPVTLEMRTESKKDARNASLSPFHDLNSRERFRESGRSEIVELDDESESGMTRVRRKHLEASKNQNQNQNQSIVRGKVSLSQVIMQAEGNSWPKHKAVSVADKLEHDNLRLESRSRSLICWKASRSARSLKLWRLKVRTRRVRLHSLLKLVSCGNNLSTRSPSR